MIKIDVDLFEKIWFGARIFFRLLFVTAIAFVVVLLAPKPDNVNYLVFLIALAADFFVAVIVFSVCVLFDLKNKRFLLLTNEEMNFCGNVYKLSDIDKCEYVGIKWYAYPFLMTYKDGKGGQVRLTLKDGRIVEFYLFKSTFNKLKCKISAVVATVNEK